jgi:hypothetical protein
MLENQFTQLTKEFVIFSKSQYKFSEMSEEKPQTQYEKP